MYGLHFSWHGWAAFALVLAAGGGLLCRLRHVVEGKWLGFVAGGALALAVVAGQLCSCYRGVAVSVGYSYEISGSRFPTRMPAVVWRAPNGREHRARVSESVLDLISPGDTLRKRPGRWFPEPAP